VVKRKGIVSDFIGPPNIEPHKRKKGRRENRKGFSRRPPVVWSAV